MKEPKNEKRANEMKEQMKERVNESKNEWKKEESYPKNERLLSKNALNWSKVTVKTFIVLQKISISNKCCFHKRY